MLFPTLFRSDSEHSTQKNLVAIILRVGLGVIFLVHGMDKIVHNGGANWVDHLYGSRAEITDFRPEGERTKITEMPSSLTFSGTQLVVAWGEFLGGLALLIGMLTRWAALGLIVLQIGAIAVVTAPRGFTFERGGGYEYNLALVCMCLALFILGAREWSVDWMVKRQSRHRAGAPVTMSPALGGPHVTAGQPMEQPAPGHPQQVG